MFTGIVHTTARVVTNARGGLTLSPKKKLRYAVSVGDSIAANGVCLTLVRHSGDLLYFQMVPETLKRTTLGKINKGDVVHLEQSLRHGDGIDGHLVQGHVDCVGVVGDTKKKGAEVILHVRLPKPWMRYIAPKGSVAVDGVSLTVVQKLADGFTVALIPHTLKNTRFGELEKGDKVNVETDMMVRAMLNAKS